MKTSLFAFLALPVSLLAQGGLPNQPYIYVEGKAEIEKPADMVTLRFNLVARNPEQLKANREIQSKAIRIVSLLSERKIGEKDIIAVDIKSEPEYEGEYPKRGKIIGYSVTRSFTIKLRDMAAFPKLVDDLLAIGGVEFSDVTSGLSDENTLHDECRKRALQNAREAAEKIVKETGMKIDSVFAVSPIGFEEIKRTIFDSRETNASYVTGASEAPQYFIPPVYVTQHVHVIYLISPTTK